MVRQHPLLIHSEVLLGEDNLAAYLPPIGHLIPSSSDISICPLAELPKKCASSLPLEGKRKKARPEAGRAGEKSASQLS